MNKLKVLILGASGRLGSALLEELKSPVYELLLVGKRQNKSAIGTEILAGDDPELGKRVENLRPDVVVNLAAVWGSHVDKYQINEVSRHFPMRIASQLGNHNVKWIQVDSYYNLQFDANGHDKDEYSKAKRVFREEFEKSFPNHLFIQAIAPHLVGLREPDHRLFGTLVRGHGLGKPFRLGPAGQAVPFLAYRDAASQVKWLVDEALSSKDMGSFRVHLKSSDCLTLRDLNIAVARLLESDFHLASFDSSKEHGSVAYKKSSHEDGHKSLPSPRTSLQQIVLGNHRFLNGFDQETGSF